MATPVDLVSFLSGAEEDGFLLFFCELAPGLVQRNFQIFEDLSMKNRAHGFLIVIDHANGFQRTFSQGQVSIGNDQGWIKGDLGT